MNTIIIFHPISPAMLKKIIDLQLTEVQKRLGEKNIKLKLTKEAREYLAKKGYAPAYGARPLKRVIQNDIMDELAMQIIEGKIKEGDKVTVEVKGDKIMLKH